MKTKTSEDEIALEAIHETEAQLSILRILAPLSQGSRERVLRATSYLIAADAAVPGVLSRFARAGAGK